MPSRVANIFGYDLLRIAKHHATIESHMRMLFEALAIDLVLDVGANTGGYGRMLRRIGYKGWIVSFEPVRRCYEALKARAVADGRWTAYNCALGARQAEMTINVPKSDDFSSFLEVNESAKQIWEDVFSHIEKERVRVERLDDVFAGIAQGLDGYRNIFLKMDTQGYDLEVLHGARKVVGGICGLQSEISMAPIYAGMPDYLESLAAFRSTGFEVTGLYPVSRNKETLLIVEMDCVMRRIDSS